MDRAQFEALVTRMETVAKNHPGAYRWRVLGWAAMGYGYLLLVIIGLLGLCGLIILSVQYLKILSIKLLILVVPAVFVLLRALWVKFDPPQGESVSAVDAPALFALLGDLQRELKTPRIHEVIVTPELNAGVTQVPRLGFLGWHRNYLLLGLPLMKGLTVEQFKAVLAHELGHLSRGHARVGNWIYRLRLIWMRLDETYAEQARVGAGLIRNFFKWYAPRFNALSFPLARANEYEADAAAAQLTSPQIAAQALTGVDVLGRYLDQKYWPDIHAAAKDRAEPAFSPYSGFVGSSVQQVASADRERWLQDAIARETSYADTHPALKDRLRAFDGKPEFAPPAAGHGAEQLLGTVRARLEQRFDEQWRERIGTSWQEFHAETQKSRARLAVLRAQPGPVDPDEDAVLERADLEERVGDGEVVALALRREALLRFPQSVGVRFVLGRQLLRAGDAEGVTLVEPLVEQEPAAASAAAELLRDYYWKAGDRTKAQAWHDRYADAAVRIQEARHEREVLRTTDRYLPHGLPEPELEKMREALRAVPAVKRAYLVRKQTRHFTDQPFYALGFSCTTWPRRADEHRTAAALDDIRKAIVFPGEALILSLEGGNSEFESIFKSVAGARIV